MNVYQKNLNQMLKYGNFVILGHIPVFCAMALFFSTELVIAIGGPLLLLVGQLFSQKVLKNESLSSILMGFSTIALSGIMIHLGKGMIEWHFHIFVTIGILSLLANPFTIVAAAATAAVHHLSFYFLLPESIFNYQANLGIVAIHAGFVVIESIACVFLAYRFKKVLDLQQQINVDISPLVESIDKASKDSSNSCNKLVGHTDSNSAAITQISSTAEEINQMVSSTKKQIEQVVSDMRSTSNSVQDSSDAIKQGDEFIQSLNDIRDRMSELQRVSSQQLSSVVDSVNTISEKTSIINDIAFQTKLLSFNASVEAARAGEHGKGFAVVAEEIGNLATTSGRASEEISAIVNNSKEQLNGSVESVTVGLTDFQECLSSSFSSWNEINSKLQESFEVVQSNSVRQERSFHEIAEAADQQSEGVRELSDALSNIDKASHEAVTQLRIVEDITTQLEEDSKKLNTIHENISGKNAA